ncbi:MAG: DNA polymerase III subunit gamma and tau [Actinomycetaceae bacterium]|nr:DNA polymerase III subunit gamma and tau [Actinomycetaceae bacterium]
MTTALYRRYRPETFTEVIGQNHVTEPLMAALRANRVTHAYLFSGPRGCGKTTSARILARCLNCAEGPTDSPCGQCESCRELATGGPGSLDVVEIDAASHNGVDDARELRERATFAPVRDRYKVFILDEAHMVTPQGFNALLKLVEEPPEHVKFIFATTEPERVIGTIRSRTHHYPFRLVPAEVMVPFLQDLCDRESVQVGEGVLPLVVRAGGGSVRDSLSVLDQLMAGGVDSQIDYARAVALLGYTDSALIDEVIEALGCADGTSVFHTIERMVDAGHDPRRFVEDFLQRLRDLLIITVTGDSARDFLVGVPHEQHERMFTQAQAWGGKRLSRAADITDEAMRQMLGATSPRLQLELLMGRLLVSDLDADATVAREDVVTDASNTSGLSGAQMAKEQLRRARAAKAGGSTGSGSGPVSGGSSVAATQSAPGQSPAGPGQPPAGPAQAPAGQTDYTPQSQAPRVQGPDSSVGTADTDERASTPSASRQDSPGDSDVEQPLIQHRWEEFLDAVEHLRRGWRQPIAQNVRWHSEDENTLTVVFAAQQMRDSFIARGNLSVFAQAVQSLTGREKEVIALGPDTAETSATKPDAAAPTAGADSPSPQATSPAQRPQPPAPAVEPSQATSTAQRPQPPVPAAPGWGPVAVAGGGIDQDMSSSGQANAETTDVSTQAVTPGGRQSPDLADEGARFEQVQSPQAEMAKNIAQENSQTRADINLSVPAAPASEQVEYVQPGVPTQVEATGDLAAAPSEAVGTNWHDGQSGAPAREDAPADGDFEDSPSYDSFDDDPTGGASLDDADAQPDVEVGLEAIRKVFNVNHFEQIDKKD